MTPNLMQKIGARAAIRPSESLYYSSISKTLKGAAGTARNMFLHGTFPFPTIKIGSKRVVPVHSFLQALGLGEATGTTGPSTQPAVTQPQRRGRGRPRKNPAVTLNGGVK